MDITVIVYEVCFHLSSSLTYLQFDASLATLRYSSKKKAFTKASKKWTDDLGKKSIEDNFNKMIRYCKVVRILVHSQVSIESIKSFQVHPRHHLVVLYAACRFAGSLCEA